MLAHILTVVRKDQDHEINDDKNTFFKMNENPDYFWKEYLKQYFEGNIGCPYFYQHSKVLTGFDVDCDVFVPCKNTNDKKPQPQNIDEDVMLAYSFAEELKKKLCEHLYVKESGNRLREHELSYVMLARTNISSQRTEKDEWGNLYVRYGFHIYFHSVKTTVSVKRYLAKELKLDQFQIFDSLMKRYKMQNLLLEDYFDKKPFIGNTMLPLSFVNQEKSYSYFVIEGVRQKINQQIHEQLLLDLNPFQGIEVQLGYDVQLDEVPQDIVSWLQSTKSSSYEQSIQKAFKFIQQKQANKQISIVLAKFNHPQHFFRESLVILLYRYYEKNMLKTQLAYYLAMCDGTEQIIDRNLQVDDLDDVQIENHIWYTNDAASKRDRYPIKVKTFVERVVKTLSKEQAPHNLVKEIVEIYNKNGEYNLTHAPFKEYEVISAQSGVLEGFTQRMTLYANGLLSEKPIEDLDDDQFKTQFNSYIFENIQKNIIVYMKGGADTQIYLFNQDDKSHDFYHYLQTDPMKFIGVMKQYYRNMIEDYSLQAQHIKKQNGGLYRVENMSRLTKTPEAFILMMEKVGYKSGQNDFQSCISSILSHKTFKCLQPDTDINIMGVYNGVVQLVNKNRLRFLEGEDARKYFTTQSTLFEIRKEIVDDDGFIKDIDEYFKDPKVQITSFGQAYNHILKIYSDIFDDQIEVFYWKIFQIFYRIFDKKTVAQCLLIVYGSGGDSKTVSTQSVLNIVGQGTPTVTNEKTLEQRSLLNGYGSGVKSNVLQTNSSNAGAHDSGGFAELMGKYMAVCSELQKDVPLSVSALKNIVGGTSISSRGAYEKKVQSFQNKTFMELQSNQLPAFDTTIDTGTQRRIFFYSHPIKFVERDVYNAMDAETKKKHRIKDINVGTLLFNNFDYIDALGLFVLNIFLKQNNDPIKSDINYVPQILKTQTQTFFSSSLKYYTTFRENIVKSTNKEDYILYDYMMKRIDVFIEKHLDQKQVAKLMPNYEYQLLEDYVNNVYVKDVKTGEVKKGTANDLYQYKISEKYKVIFLGLKFDDEMMHLDNIKACELIFKKKEPVVMIIKQLQNGETIGEE